MSKKLLGVGVALALVAAVLVGGASVASANANCDMITVLANAGLISSSNLAVAQAAAGCGAAAPASYMFTRELTVGSTGADVTALQTKLGVSPATGYFGPLTKAAVQAYQTANGIPATGYVGPLTLAKLNYVAPVVPVTPVTPVTPVNPGLDGTAGELSSIKETTTGVETLVAEDSSEKVLGIELEAGADSDIAVTSLKLEFTKGGSGVSTRLDRYVDSVDILQGSTVVGSADVDDFTKVTAGNYTKTISLSNTVVKADEKSKLYVKVNTVNSIDSEDTASNWVVEVISLRAKDAEGSVLSYGDADITGTVAATVTFEESTANDALKLQASSVNPVASNLQVDETSTSDDYMVFAFKLKADADSSDLDILSIPVVMTIDNASTTAFNSDELINDIYLKVGSDDYTDYDNTVVVAGASATTTTYTFNIDAGDLTIEAGDTVEVKVYVSLGAQEDNYDVGTTIKAAITGAIEVENVDGDSVPAPTNDVTGNTHTVQLEAVNFVLKTPTVVNSSESASIDPYVTITMPLQITSDEVLYILKSSTDTEDSIDHTVTGDAGTSYTTSFTTGTDVPTIVTDSGEEYYQIDGTNVIYIKFIATGDISGTVQNLNVALDSVTAATELGGSTVTYTLSPASSFDVDSTLRQ